MKNKVNQLKRKLKQQIDKYNNKVNKTKLY